MNIKKLTHFVFEIGQLKRIPHIGWLHAGIKDPERVGEHVFRATQIAYLLADLEGADENKTSMMTLIHDNGEARIGDHDLITRQYIDTKKAEQKAFNDQIQWLPPHIADKWKQLFEEREACETKEAQCSKDADMLEQAFQAKEYLDLGNPNAQRWIDQIEGALHTDSSKKIMQELKNTSFSDWWPEFKKDQV
ncbi:MAG: HD domain-containing protein [Candidatus Gracilibacteria bacterium]|nr:HD domain-containing protein [Candidatus Gracilibacteria bacterium]